MKLLVRTLERTLTVAGSIFTIALALGVSAILDALWPAGVVIAEGIAIAILAVLLVRERRRVVLLPADQTRLDELLGLLNRPAVKAIEVEDFTSAWPTRITFPITTLTEEFDGVEHRFQDPALEKLRAPLFSSAERLAAAWAANAWMHPRASDRLYVGVIGGEAEGDPELTKRLYDRANAIRAPKWEFIDAHRALLATAIERGYDVSAVKGDRPPHPSVARREQHEVKLRLRFGPEA